jgi:two-component system chemotaxis response regulator CheY
MEKSLTNYCHLCDNLICLQPILSTNPNESEYIMSKKVLIVDDSKISRMFIRQHISAKHPDWILSEATTGEEAITMIDAEQPDYCTMDINMPGMLGTDAAKAILEKYSNIRLVIFSANVQETYQEQARALGTIFISKPVTETSIGQAIDYFLGV